MIHDFLSGTLEDKTRKTGQGHLTNMGMWGKGILDEDYGPFPIP